MFFIYKLFDLLRIKNKVIHLDKASTKKMNKKWNRLLYIENERSYQNLSSFSPKSIENKKEFEKIKEYFRVWLSAPNYSIVFTSGATESLNMALKGISFQKIYLEKSKKRVFNIVLSKI